MECLYLAQQKYKGHILVNSVILVDLCDQQQDDDRLAERL